MVDIGAKSLPLKYMYMNYNLSLIVLVSAIITHTQLSKITVIQQHKSFTKIQLMTKKNRCLITGFVINEYSDFKGM